MKTGRSSRHALLEIAVFAAALLLAAFVGREAWLRRAPSAEPAAVPEAGRAARPFTPEPSRPPLPESLRKSLSERGVTSVPPIRMSRERRPKPKPASVPVPR